MSEVVQHTIGASMPRGLLNPNVDSGRLKLKAETFTLGAWTLTKVNQPLLMDRVEQVELSERLSEWVAVFPKTPANLTQQEEGVPSALVRFDYTYTPRLRIGPQIYEIEERPAGMGIAAVLNGKFRDGFVRSVEFWQKRFKKELAVCISDERAGTSDDEFWAATLLRQPIRVCKGVPPPEDLCRYIWWPRTSRHESAYYGLTPHSLSTNELEGDKSYGVSMGLWHHIGRPSDISFRGGCALKPKAGSRFENIQLVGPGAQHAKGCISIQRALREIGEGKFAYWQPYHEPERTAQHPWLLPDYHLIRRVYFAYSAPSVGAPRYLCLGGCWMATPTARVHGTTETLTGPIYPHTLEWL